MLILSLFLPGASTHAQGMSYATITVPDTSKYPILTTYLDTFDDQGSFVNNLTTSDVSILENGKQLTLDHLDSLEVPLSLVLAINSDPALAVRDGLGVSRYNKILAALDNWAVARPSDSQDKLALTWNGGVVASRLGPAAWKTRLDNFDPAPRATTSSLAALAYALDAAQEAEAGTGVKKSILLISGHLSTKSQAGINDLINRAKQSGVRVYVWIVDSKAFQENPGAVALQDLALATGGRFSQFTNDETLPNLEEWFVSLRQVYQLTYRSNIRAAGQQSLSVQVNSGNLSLTSPAVSFQFDVQPPSAALLSAPIQIVRQNPESPFDLQSFKPIRQEISILVEFPDGHTRPLKRTSLYVDGQKVAENTSEPFNRFIWDLSGYQASADHALEVEVEDVLGLSRKSAEVPVQVNVIQPPGGMAGLILRNRMAVTITFMILAGVVVLGIIILGGRRGLATLAERRNARTARLDPVTQPVHVQVEPDTAARTSPFPWLRRRSIPPPAYFVRLTKDGAPGEGDPIPIFGREITFGTDPTQATVVLDHPSLSLLHARLRYNADDSFMLLDQNSVAGTWVNYELVPPEGRTLQHGDVIHLGRLIYRFVLAKPPVFPKPTINPINDG